MLDGKHTGVNFLRIILVDWYGMFGVCVILWPPFHTHSGFRRRILIAVITGLDSSYKFCCAESKEVDLQRYKDQQRAAPWRTLEEDGEVGALHLKRIKSTFGEDSEMHQEMHGIESRQCCQDSGQGPGSGSSATKFEGGFRPLVKDESEVMILIVVSRPTWVVRSGIGL